MSAVTDMRAAASNIPAVFPSHRDAEDALADLSTEGIVDEHFVDVARRSLDRVLEIDAQRSVFRSFVVGFALGMPVGAITAALVVAGGRALAGLPTEAATIGIAAAVGGACGAVFFAIVAAVASVLDVRRDQERWDDVPLRPEETLVVVGDHGCESRVKAIFRRHGARLLPPRAA